MHHTTLPPLRFHRHSADLSEFTDLPVDLRGPARDLLQRFLAEFPAARFSRAEIVRAIKSKTFRPVLEQEARLDTLTLVS
ncbi:MAG TPA: hypothetical protein VGE72_00610 [Azospirillum sp.]